MDREYGFECHKPKVHQMGTKRMWIGHDTAFSENIIMLFVTNNGSCSEGVSQVARISRNVNGVVKKMSWIKCIVRSHTKQILYLFAYLIHLTSTKHLIFLGNTRKIFYSYQTMAQWFFPLDVVLPFFPTKILFRVIWNIVKDAIALHKKHTHH